MPERTPPVALPAPGQPLVRQAVVWLVSIGFIALVVAAFATAVVQYRNESDASWVQHTLEVETHISDFANAVERIETARRGILLSDDPVFRDKLHEAVDLAHAQIARIEDMTGDNPRQKHRTEVTRMLVALHQKAEDEAIADSARLRGAFTADFGNDLGVRTTRALRAQIHAMDAEERKLLLRRQMAQHDTAQMLYLVLGTTILLVLGVGIATALLLRRTLSDLRASQTALAALNDDLEAEVDARTSELQRANAEIQRFAYIVSHDLRSPLVNVMGFTAELDAARATIHKFIGKLDETGTVEIERNVREAVEEDLPESIGFIRSSTQKMDRLINAILRLSREGRRNLAPERLELAEVVRTIADTLEHRVQESGTKLEIGALPTIVCDRVAVEQILSNLIENALKYHHPGRTPEITVSGRTHHGRALIDVTDNGRGIDPRDHERVFDLFRRSGQQDQPGEGIGLAHVRALAYRLGGNIGVRSQLGEGSTFRLTLPVEWHGDAKA